jgi:hypothetical protein
MRKVLLLSSALLSLSLFTSCQLMEPIVSKVPSQVGSAVEKEIGSFTLKKLGQEKFESEGCALQATKLGSNVEKILADRLKVETNQKFIKETGRELCRFGIGKLDQLANLASTDYRCLALAGVVTLEPLLLPVCDKI